MREIKEIFDNAQAALNDERDPIKTYEDIEEISMQLENLKKELKPKVLDELHNYGGEYNSRFFKFKQIEAGVKYDYSVTRHPEWHRLTAEIEKFTELRKQLEDFLKGIKQETNILVDDEVVKIYPVPRKSTTTFKLTINK